MLCEHSSISYFQMCNIALLTVVTMLYITSLWLIHFITGNLYLLTSFTHFTHPHFSSQATTNLFPIYMNSTFLILHIKETVLTLTHPQESQTNDSPEYKYPSAFLYSQENSQVWVSSLSQYRCPLPFESLHCITLLFWITYICICFLLTERNPKRFFCFC